MITFEVCCCTEWLRDCAGLDLDLIEDGYENEAADRLESRLHWNLEDAGFRTVRPQGQRILYHGWNGANTFRHRLGAVATFDDMTEDEKAAAWAAIEKSVAEAQSAFAKDKQALETIRTIAVSNGKESRILAVLKDCRGTWLHDIANDPNADSLEMIVDDSNTSIMDAIRDSGFEIITE